MNYEFYWLVINVLVVWRFAHLLFAEDGPWNLIVRLRRWVGNGFWGSLMDCFYCLSLWVAFPAAMLAGQGWKQRLLLWPALSAGAILVERATSKTEPEPRPSFTEEEELDYVLRQTESSTANDCEATRF